MRTHDDAVHAKSDPCDFLAAPVKGPIRVALGLPFVVPGAGHVIEEVLCLESGEPPADAVTELMTQADNLVPVHVETVIEVVVAREQLV